MSYNINNASRRGSKIETVPIDDNVLHPTDTNIVNAAKANPAFAGLSADSKDATEQETSMSVMQSIKLYKKAIAWSVLLSTAIIMEGYDVVLLANFYALPQFLAKFGDQVLADGTKTISAPWRSGLSNGALVGEILGLFATGIFQDRYGYKKTIGGALIGMISFIFITFFAVNLPMLLAGEILCGLCWGVFQTITTAYASEVTPVNLRAYLTTYVNLCWVLGQFVASGVLRAMLDRPDEYAYKIPFALQWMWPVPILIGCILCPESPWWLVRKGRFDDAKRSLQRLTSPNQGLGFDADKTVAMMTHTNEIEIEMTKGTSYLDCFRGTNLRRTEIASVAWLIQNVCGSTFMGYSTVFYLAAGLPKSSAFDLSMAQYALGACGTIASWFLMSYVGRRSIYLYGSVALFTTLIIIGFCGIAQHNTSAQWAIGSMLLIFTAIYDLTVGPACYSLVAEIPSTRLKAKTIVIARNVYNIGGIVVNVITNYQLTETAWNWGAYSGFFWAGTCFLCIVYIYFRLPEPKGRSYGELDILFGRKVSARKFHKTNVDIFRGETVAAVEASSPASSLHEKKGGIATVERVGTNHS